MKKTNISKTSIDLIQKVLDKHNAKYIISWVSRDNKLNMVANSSYPEFEKELHARLFKKEEVK